MHAPFASKRLSVACCFFALYAAWGPSAYALAAIAPFPGHNDYIEQGVFTGAKTGPHRSVFTTRFNGEPVVVSRPLSVRPESSLNGDLGGNHSPRLGPRALPPMFGGYTTVVYAMKEATPFTTRAQFHDGPSNRNDFINLNVYLESNQPNPGGIEFSFTGAFLLHSGDSGAPKAVVLEDIADVSFLMASQRPYARVTRILVRDADSGCFYVSESSSTENRGVIAFAGANWAKINPADLTLTSGYVPAPFQRVDHIGVYAAIPVTEITEVLNSFGVMCNLALHSLEYTLTR